MDFTIPLDALLKNILQCENVINTDWSWPSQPGPL